MTSSNDLQLLRDALQDPRSASLTEQQQHELVDLGVVVTLEQLLPQDAAAAGVLLEVAQQHRMPAVRAQAYAALERQAAAGRPSAIDALYRLAVEDASLPARQALLANDWQPSIPELGTLLLWETGPIPAGQLDRLTAAFFQEASPRLQQRMLQTAPARGMQNWAGIVSALQNGRADALRGLLQNYPRFQAEERQLVIDRLQQLASSGSADAREALAQLSITHEDPTARQLAMEHGYAPEDPEQRALFLFLASDWEHYEALDFDHNLLVSAYENAPRALRRRILDHSRYTGYIEWLRDMHTAVEPRWLKDLSDADWELTVSRLAEAGRYSDLWRLAQAAPPAWSAAALEQLDAHGWSPEDREGQGGFFQLLVLARAARSQPWTLQPRATWQAAGKTLTRLALAEQAQLLAAGTTENEIMRWQLPDGDPLAPSLLLPGAQVRAVAIRPDAGLIAAASSDHRIRIFRLPDGTLLKTMEGHQAMIREIVMHPDGHALYSAGFDGAVRVWRFPTGPLLKTLQPGAGEQFALNISMDGKRLFSGGADGMLRVWALPEAALTREIPAHHGMLTQIAASPSADLLATAGPDGFLRVWNAASGRLVRSMTCLQPVTALAMHPNEGFVASGHANGTLGLWSVSTGRTLVEYAGKGSPITSLIFSRSGDTLYSAMGDRVVVWDLAEFLALTLPNSSSADDLAVRAHAARGAGSRAWLAFAAELARWRQRYDIELDDSKIIPVGSFDIEL